MNLKKIFCLGLVLPVLQIQAPKQDEPALFDEVICLLKELPDSQKIIQAWEFAINSKNLECLKACQIGLEKYTDSFINLKNTKILRELYGQKLTNFKNSAKELGNLINHARITISRACFLSKKEVLKARRLAKIKNLAIKAGCTGIGMFSGAITNFNELNLSSFSNILKSAHFYKFGLTGLGISAFMALIFSMKSRNSKNALSQAQHLNSMIFSLFELSWQMNNLFAEHKKSLANLKTVLSQLKGYFEQLISLVEIIGPQEHSLNIDLLMSQELNEFTQLCTQIYSQRIAIMALTKVMRALTSKNTEQKNLEELILQFSDLEKLRQINPIGVENIEADNQFFISNYQNTHNLILKFIKNYHSAPQSNDLIDLSWIETAKKFLNSSELFFGLGKPGYYSSTIESFIQDAEAQIKRIM